MTDDTKQIPLLIVLEYMKRVNNLLNKLIREDNFPAILFAKYDNTFHDLLKMAQVMNYKYRDVLDAEMNLEADKFMKNLDKWENEYREAMKSQSKNSLGITEIESEAKCLVDEAPKEIEHMTEKVKTVLGKDLFDEVMGRIQSKSREAALSELLTKMAKDGDLDDEVVN